MAGKKGADSFLTHYLVMTNISSPYFSQIVSNDQRSVHQNSLQTDMQNPILSSSVNSSLIQSVKLVTPYFSGYASDNPVLVQRIPDTSVKPLWTPVSVPDSSSNLKSRKV